MGGKKNGCIDIKNSAIKHFWMNKKFTKYVKDGQLKKCNKE